MAGVGSRTALARSSSSGSVIAAILCGLARAVGGAADPRAARQPVGERLRVAFVDERHDRAAEAAACHPRGKSPVLVGEVDEAVELRDRRLEIVAHAVMARPEELADALQVVRAQRLDDAVHARVLRLEVT